MGLRWPRCGELERMPFTWDWSSLRRGLRPSTWKGSSRRTRLLVAFAALGVPLVLGAILVPSSHYEVMKVLLISYVLSAAAGGLYSLAVDIVRAYRLATPPGTNGEAFAWRAALTSRRGYLTAAFTVAAGVLFGLISLGAIRGVRSSAPIIGISPPTET